MTALVHAQTSQPDGRRLYLYWAAAVVALPMMIPYRWPPLLSFYQDAAAYLIAAVGAAVLLRSGTVSERRVLALPAVALAPLALLAVLTLQQLLQRIAYLQHYAVASLALVVAVLAMSVGQRVLRADLPRAATAVAVAVLVCAMAQLGWGVAQLAGYEWQGFRIIERAPEPYRVSGFVAQANQFSVIQVWALIAAFYLALRRRIPAALAVAIALLCMTGAALAGSKGTYLYLGVIGMGLSVWMRTAQRHILWWVPLAAALAYVPWAAAVEAFAQATGAFGALETGRPLASASTAARLGFLRDGWALFASAPWLGVGWYGFAGARWSLPAPTPLELHADHAHNVVINLLAEVGLVGFAAVVVPLLLWLWRVLRGGVDLERAFLLALLGVIALYSLLEFPLWLGHFLVPCALFVGMLEPRCLRAPVSANLARTLRVATWSLPVAIVVAVVDYTRIESVYRAFFGGPAQQLPTSGEVARLTNATLFRREAEEIYLLTAPIDTLHATFNLALSERAFLSRPVPPLAAVRAAYLLLAQDPTGARRVVDRTCQWSADGCLVLMRRFRALAEEQGSPFTDFEREVFRVDVRP